MKVFVIFGSIEFTGGVAYVWETKSASFMDVDDVEEAARKLDCDCLIPHYFDGKTIFGKLHKETL
jgi:hypothetical protein